MATLGEGGLSLRIPHPSQLRPRPLTLNLHRKEFQKQRKKNRDQRLRVWEQRRKKLKPKIWSLRPRSLLQLQKITLTQRVEKYIQSFLVAQYKSTLFKFKNILIDYFLNVCSILFFLLSSFKLFFSFSFLSLKYKYFFTCNYIFFDILLGL